MARDDTPSTDINIKISDDDARVHLILRGGLDQDSIAIEATVSLSASQSAALTGLIQRTINKRLGVDT